MKALGWLLLLLCLGQAELALAVDPVGALGGVGHLAISGTTAFSAEQIKDALYLNPEFQLASDATSPRSDYLKTIERLICQGYRYAGFPDAVVTANADAKNSSIAVAVKEGTRFTAGDIEVRGGKTIPLEQLIKRLTESYPARNAIAASFSESQGKTVVSWTDRNGQDRQLCDPIWCPGKPARFLTSAESRTQLNEQVADALADLGYFFTEFSADIVADTVTKKAKLTIDVSRESARSFLGDRDVRVSGNEANSREGVLKYLEFKPGVPATRQEVVRLQDKLWHSGRFIKSTVVLSQPATAADPPELRIDLIELHGATPLGKQLSREEDIFLKCHRQMASLDRWGGDLVLQLNRDTGSTSLVFSPGNGVILDWTYDTKPTPTGYTIACSPKEIGVYHAPDARKFVTFPPNAGLIGSIVLRLDDDANNKKEPRNLAQFGFGFASICSTSKMPLDLRLTCTPSYCIDLAHRAEAKYAICDGILTMSGKGETLRVDANSGRLIEFVLEGEPAEDSNNGKRDAIKASSGKVGGIMRLSVASNEFRRRVDAVHRTFTKTVNSHDANHPVSSLLKFAAAEDRVWQSLGIQDDAIRQLGQKLLDRDVCEPFDKLVSESSAKMHKDEERFSIPLDNAVAQHTAMAYTQSIVCSAFVIGHSVFGVGSWPEVVSRNAWLTAIGQEKATTEQLRRIYDSDRSGPLCFLTAATLLMDTNPSLARLMVQRGQERLSLDDFRKEYPTLLNQKYPIGPCILRTASFLREMNDRDMQSICSLLPKERAVAFRQGVAKLQQSNQPLEPALPILLDVLWQNGLREYVEAAFAVVRGYSDSFASAKPSEQTIANATQAMRFAPKDAKLYKERALAYGSKKATDNAIADYTEAIRLCPNDADLYWGRGTLYHTRGNETVESVPSEPAKPPIDGATFNLSQYLDGPIPSSKNSDSIRKTSEDYFDKAIADYNEAILLDPKLVSVYYNRSLIHLAKGNNAQAKADMAEVKKLKSAMK